MIYYKVMSSNPVHGKSERSTVDLADQEVCLKYEAEAEIANLRAQIDSLKDCYNCKYNEEGSDGCEGCNPVTIPKWEHFK